MKAMIEALLARMESRPDAWRDNMLDQLARLSKRAEEPLDGEGERGPGKGTDQSRDDVVDTVLFMLVERAHQYRLLFRIVSYAFIGLLLLGLLK